MTLSVLNLLIGILGSGRIRYLMHSASSVGVIFEKLMSYVTCKIFLEPMMNDSRLTLFVDCKISNMY